jgi:ABC-type nickel/cobalt efflux system permease component RcnA
MKRIALAAAAIIGAVMLWPASPAAAHPLGNYSINQYVGLALRPDAVDATVVVDRAELPTLQERAAVDTDGDGSVSAAESATHAGPACGEVAAAISLRVRGKRATWRVTESGHALAQGSGGLPTSRLTCALTAPANLSAAARVQVDNAYGADRVGWREMVAVGDGVRLVGSPLPERSVSGQLRSYPKDPLASTPDVRSATLEVAPGGSSGGGGPAAAGPGEATPGEGGPAGWLAAADRRLQALAGGELTPAVGVLAVLLALLLGAGHAALPGHGKTVLAAYAAGREGRLRHAVAVGATVTVTHTGGVLVVGLLLTASSTLAGERLSAYLGIASGALVVAVGVGMLVGVFRRRESPDHHHHHGHGHGHGHHHHHHHDHHHRPSRWSLAGIGIAGGLVPSPSALVVLLAAIGLGRTGFGVLLVIAYGLGMAATLTAAGLLLVAVRRRLPARLSTALRRLPRATSGATAGLVLVVGLGLAARAAASVW